MNTKIRLIVASLLLVAFSSSVAESALVYDIFLRIPSPDREGLDARFDVATGQVFNASVVLRETVTDGTPSPLEASNLSGFGFNLFATGGDGAFRNLAVDTSGGAEGESDNDTGKYFALGVPFFNQPGKPGVVIGAANSGIREIQLATVELIAPTAGETTFLVQDENLGADGDFGSFTTPSFEAAARGTAGGAFNSRSMTLAVTAIPEPSSFALLMTAGAIVTMRRRPRRA